MAALAAIGVAITASAGCPGLEFSPGSEEVTTLLMAS